MLTRLVPEGLIAILADCHDTEDPDRLRSHVRALVADVRTLQHEVAKLTEALDAMSEDLLAAMKARGRAQTAADVAQAKLQSRNVDLALLDTARQEALQQRDAAEARCDVLQDALSQALKIGVPVMGAREEWSRLRAVRDGKEPR